MVRTPLHLAVPLGTYKALFQAKFHGICCMFPRVSCFACSCMIAGTVPRLRKQYQLSLWVFWRSLGTDVVLDRMDRRDLLDQQVRGPGARGKLLVLISSCFSKGVLGTHISQTKGVVALYLCGCC
jgi:hypothetical protein